MLFESVNALPFALDFSMWRQLRRWNPDLKSNSDCESTCIPDMIPRTDSENDGHNVEANEEKACAPDVQSISDSESQAELIDRSESEENEDPVIGSASVNVESVNGEPE